MIIEAPLNTRTEFSSAAPGPETNKHWAIPSASLMRYNMIAVAEQLHANAKQGANIYREYHLGLAQNDAERAFVNRLADDQEGKADALHAENLASIDAKVGESVGYEFFTGGEITEHPDAWVFDAPAGFGDLSVEEKTKIALAQRG